MPRALARAKASVRGTTVSSVSGKPFQGEHPTVRPHVVVDARLVSVIPDTVAKRREFQQQVVMVTVYGDVDERTLKEYAKQIRNEIVVLLNALADPSSRLETQDVERDEYQSRIDRV